MKVFKSNSEDREIAIIQREGTIEFMFTDTDIVFYEFAYSRWYASKEILQTKKWFSQEMYEYLEQIIAD